jgi:small subunit ribosomal protein SAe
MWWMLAREVLKLKMELIIEDAYFVLGEQTIMPDLYFYRDPEEQKKEEEEAKQQAKEAAAAGAPEFPQPVS